MQYAPAHEEPRFFSVAPSMSNASTISKKSADGNEVVFMSELERCIVLGCLLISLICMVLQATQCLGWFRWSYRYSNYSGSARYYTWYYW